MTQPARPREIEWQALRVEILRRFVAVVLVLIGATMPLSGAMVAEIGASYDVSPIDGFLGTLQHLLMALPIAVLIGSFAALLIIAGRRVWFHPYMTTAFMFVPIYAPIAGWIIITTINVRFDTSTPETHTVKLVGWSLPRKGNPSIEVTSWKHPSDTLTLETYAREAERVKGAPVSLVVHQGALRLAYANNIRIMVP